MASTDWWFLVGLLVLTLLLTGPGMWSEKWGWGVFRRRKRTPRGPDDAGQD